MIKRIQFATRRPSRSRSDFVRAWPQAARAATQAPPGARPLRVAVNTVVFELSGPHPQHDGIALCWFADEDHAYRYEAWLESTEARTLTLGLDELLDRDRSPTLLAQEHVLRGADWLAQRWQEGGEKLKHMAIAQRADGLSLEEFSERWRNRAGTIRRSGTAEMAPIPEEARGLAYIQNHPIARATGEWAYDALNEVYFDDVTGLRRRMDWFSANLSGGIEEDLVRASWFVAAREVPC